MSVRDQALRHRSVLLDPLRLKVRLVWAARIRPLVPIKPEPSQAIDDAGHHFPRRSFGVGILDAQHKRAPLLTREEPIEQRRPRAADVEIAGWRGGEADSDHFY